MQWKTIRLPAFDKDTPEKLVGALDAIRDEAGSMTTEQQKYEADLAKIRSVDPEKMSPDQFKQRDKLSGMVISLLQREISLRRSLLDLLTEYSLDRLEVLSRLREQDMPKFAADLKEKLVGIGYLDTGNHIERGSIIPDFIHRHPQYLAKRDRVRELESMATLRMGFVEENNKAIDAARDKITAINAGAFGNL